MTKEEIRKVLDLALEYYKLEIFGTGKESQPPTQERIDYIYDRMQQSLPSDLDEAAIDAAQLDMQNRQIMEASNDERLRYSRIFRRGFKAGAEWMNWQDRKIWNSSIRSVPEGDKSQILSFDEEGYFYLNRKPHPDSVGWCFAKELLPIRKKQ